MVTAHVRTATICRYSQRCGDEEAQEGHVSCIREMGSACCCAAAFEEDDPENCGKIEEHGFVVGIHAMVCHGCRVENQEDSIAQSSRVPGLQHSAQVCKCLAQALDSGEEVSIADGTDNFTDEEQASVAQSWSVEGTLSRAQADYFGSTACHWRLVHAVYLQRNAAMVVVHERKKTHESDCDEGCPSTDESEAYARAGEMEASGSSKIASQG